MIIYDSLYRLKKYCEKEQFMGWDPYDGLNSKLFHAIPFLDKIPFCRLVMIQTFKRNPFNLRRLALIPKQHNAKGIGLLLQGYCNLYKAVQKDHKLVELFGSAQDIVTQTRELADLLIEMRSDGD
ncbi:MAG: delta-aminolevulinic acid dehydratase, partial [Sodaliphilus sp.]|nr:delta-aminolevulinic acid dehydratase [Sodaliphilus sp.]